MIRKLLSKLKLIRFVESEKYKLLDKDSLFAQFHNSKTIFIHIPKTGGTSVFRSIYGNAVAEGHRSFSFYKLLFSDDFNDFFKFCFVRNPYDRLYSAYKFLQRGGNNTNDVESFRIYMKDYSGFRDFVLNGLTENLLREVIHLVPQTNFICDANGLVAMDFIGKFESIEEDFLILSKKLDKDITLQHLNRNKKQSYLEVYDKDMKLKVKKLYKNDFKLLGY